MPNKEQRNEIIENFQRLLRRTRPIMNYSVAELAEMIGVTRQTMNNLETYKTNMSQTQYIALAAVFDHYFKQDDELRAVVETIIDQEGQRKFSAYDTSFRDGSLLARWFDGAERCGQNPSAGYAYVEDLCVIAEQYLLFLDTTVLTTEDGESVAEDLIEALRASERKVIVPFRSVEQLNDPAGGNAHLVALEYLNRMKVEGLLDIRGEKSDPDFRDTVLSVFTRYRSMYRLCLITQNRILAEDVLRLNDGSKEDDMRIIAGFVRNDRFFSYPLPSDGDLFAQKTADFLADGTVSTWGEAYEGERSGSYDEAPETEAGDPMPCEEEENV